jgi:hypothetical protein
MSHEPYLSGVIATQNGFTRSAKLMAMLFGAGGASKRMVSEMIWLLKLMGSGESLNERNGLWIIGSMVRPLLYHIRPLFAAF